MAITISGENNNDKILASDGVIDQISGFNIVGVVTATTFTGNLIGNVTGNLTGNVNSTSPLLLQTGGSERFRITGNNELGIAGANYGSAGQVLTSGGSGSAVTWSAIPSQVNITNNADNRVITGGSGVNLNGEANLTYNGQKLNLGTVDGGSDVIFALRNTNASGFGAYISGGGNNSQYILRLDDKDQNECFRVTGDGNVGILNGSPQRKLHIGNSAISESNIRIQGGADYAEIRVKDSDNNISFHHNVGGAGSREMFSSNGSTGHFSINCFSYQALTITTNENGTNGPEVQLMHNTTSPDANDTIGQLRFSGKDSAGNTELYSKIETKVTNVTSGSETAHIDFSTKALSAFNPILRLSARSTASAPSYTTDDMNGIILDTYNTGGGSGYARYFSFIAKSAGNTDSNIGFWTEKVGGSPAERLRITSDGYLFLRDNGVIQTNTTLSYQYEGAFLTHYTARTTAGGDRYRRMLDIASVGANPHGSSIRLLTSPDDTNPATTVERVRIDHNGRVGINKSQPQTMLSIKAERSAVPRFGIDGHYSDSSYTQSTWDDSNGLYTLLGVNHKLDANGNDATPVASLHSSSIFLDGRSGSTRFYVKPNSGTTFTEAMRINKHGIVTTPKQPAFRSYTVQDGNSNGTVANIYTTGAADSGIYDLNDDFNESTGQFTAPVDGVYQVSIAWDENNSNTIIDLQINGSGAHYSTEARTSGSGWNSWFTSSTVYLEAGDYISINLRGTSGSYPFHQAGGRWGHFSAHLIA